MTDKTNLGKTVTAAMMIALLCISDRALSQESSASTSKLARRILADAEVKGGLVVHIGCGDGNLTAALHANDSYLVHGLDTDAAKVAKAREHIRSEGLTGVVSVDKFDGKLLPYADNLVNLVVIQDAKGGARDAGCRIRDEEIKRVLAPGGVALAFDFRLLTLDSFHKPWPDDIDQWTHFLHDASNNAVAQDSQVGPPRRLKWKCGPLWSRSHEFISSVPAMISAGGRMFYVVDEGLTSITDEPIPDHWVLIARDAFNGVLLWKRPLPDWRGDEWRGAALRGRPPSVPRRIVGDNQSLYATLSHRGPLEILDPATGKTLETIDGTASTQEILQSGRTLVLRLAPIGARNAKQKGEIVAVNADSGQVRWRASANQYLSQTLAAGDDRVVYSTGTEIVCLTLAAGEESWRQPMAKGKRARERTIILHGDLVLEGGANNIVARSTKTGETQWTTNTGGGSMRPADMFVANGCVWHASSEGITGYDLATGKPAKVIDPSSVQSPGHHLRCYRAKATERFLITQFRGAEFVSLTDDDHVNNDWIRGACRYGVMPSNGLLYVPPTPCFCYPGVKLTGLLALAPGEELKSGEVEESRSGMRLEEGPAFGAVSDQQSAVSKDDWPMYRRDGRRSGATATEVPAEVPSGWQVNLRGPLTPPVACDNRVCVAAKDQHTLYALDVDDGGEVWHFTAGGRIDSPPTVHGGSVLLGCADGWVYCVRAADGELTWRFRAAPSDQRIVAFSQLESPWRVHGSVLIEDGVAYCTAGRSTYLDGGIWIYGLDPKTGDVIHETHLDTWSPTRQDAVDKPYIPSYHMEGTHSDILVSQGGYIYLGQYKFDRELTRQDAPYVMRDPNNPVVAMDVSKEGYTVADPDLNKGYDYIRAFHRYMEKAHPELAKQYKEKYGGMNMGDRNTGMHLAPTAGFLDDTWFNRTFWMYSANWPGWYHAHRGAKTGQLLVMGPERTYALQSFPTRNRQSPLFTPGAKGYLLLADDNDTEPVLDDMTRGATKGLGYTRLKPPVWFDWVPIRIRGMVLAGNHLFVAGPPDVVDTDDPMASFEGRKGGVLRTYSAAEGKRLAETTLQSPPVFDGLIVASGRLFMSTVDGHVVCLGRE